jgi:hypothetical protein
MKYKTTKPLLILGGIFIILTLIYFFISKAYNNYEQFQSEPETTNSDAKELNKYAIDSQTDEPPNMSPKKMMSDSKSVPIDNGVCENARDPVSVCMNYDSCCTASDNCVCQNPVNKDCQSVYKDCLADKYLSETNMDYISAEKKDVICKKIKANCCKSVLNTKNAKRTDYEQVTMSMPDTYSSSLCSFTGDESSAIAACKQSCNLNDKCRAVVYNKGMGRCDIYDKPLITKPGFLKNDTDAETIQFQRVGREGFQQDIDRNASEINNAESYCYADGMNDGGSEPKSCYKKNGIVSDCRTQFDKCITRDIPGLSATKKKEHCATMYGSCCSIVDGLDVTDRYKFLGVELGAGNPKNKLCSLSVSKLDECKAKCLEAPNCHYIYSNLGAPLLLGEKAVKRCDLYSGKPVTGFIPTFSKDSVSGKFIYRKAEVNPDDEINITTTTTNSQE